MPAVVEHPSQAGETPWLVALRVMQIILSCLTQMIDRARYCCLVVTHPRTRWRLRDWGRRSATWVLIAEPLVMAWIVAETIAAITAGIDVMDLARFGLFLTCAFAYVIGTTVAEERRRGQHGNNTHVDHTSLYFFPAALILPVPLTMLLIIVIRIHRWCIARKPVYKFTHTTFAICFSALAVHAVAAATPLKDWMTGAQPLPATMQDQLVAAAALIGTITAYFTAQAVMVGAVRALSLDVWDKPRTTRPAEWKREVTEHALGTPLDNAEILGVLVIGATIAGVAAWALPMLLVAIPVAIGFSVVVQYVELLKRTATIDGKTGLLTPSTFQDNATKILARGERAGTPTAVLILDLDHFKMVNDTFGHLVGDEVLAAVAGELRAAVRQGDEVCRWGGEEMVALLPGTDRAEASALAERIRARVEAMVVPITRAAGGDVVFMGEPDNDGNRHPDEIRTVSIGVATIPDNGHTLAEALHHADEALYAAKRSGRNRVCVAAPTPWQDAEQRKLSV